MKIKKFTLNQKEISKQLLKGEPTMGLLQEIASGVAQRAGDGYETNAFEKGKYRGNVSVRAATKEAKKDNLTNNTLLKAVKQSYD